MAIRVLSTSTASQRHGIKCMVYGPPGVGKTRLLASAPSPIILSAESGLLSLRSFNLPYININNMKDLLEAYQYVSGPNGNQFSTIGLDSSSEIAEVCLEEAKRTNKDGRKAYAEAGEQMVDVFRRFRDIPGKNVVFLAKQGSVEVNGMRMAAPSFPGQALANNAPYFFDEVFQLNAWKSQDGQRMWGLRCWPDNLNTAKDRSGVLSEWENADPNTGGGLQYLFNKMLAA